ncbi:uncharacterized protein METZ01_LOCUS25249 [marine metagenome]|uniref:Uncharacterized protein n=1 Tax=marine metagenome TaxID=408172 RepID=A0A381PZD2_9ZZZZ
MPLIKTLGACCDSSKHVDIHRIFTKSFSQAPWRSSAGLPLEAKSVTS